MMGSLPAVSIIEWEGLIGGVFKSFRNKIDHFTPHVVRIQNDVKKVNIKVKLRYYESMMSTTVILRSILNSVSSFNLCLLHRLMTAGHLVDVKATTIFIG